jgi:hypothetical protein
MTEAWEQPGLSLMTVLWQRVRSQAREAGISLQVGAINFDTDEIPKDLSKMQYFTTILETLVKHDPSKIVGSQGSVEPYVRQHLAPVLGMRRNRITAKVKQNALWQLKTDPNFTKLASNYNHDLTVKQFEHVRLQIAEDPAWIGNPAREELTQDWNLYKVHGHINPLFVLGHMDAMNGRGMPWAPLHNGKKQTLPAPLALYTKGSEEVLAELKYQGRPFLKLAHLLPGSMGATAAYLAGKGVVRIANNAGAAGYPYTNDPDARSKTSDGKRPTKANVVQEEIRHLLPWLLADCPFEGELWDRIAQPNTVWNRGDATVDVRLLALARALHNAGYPLLALLLPGRGIAIVATIQTLLELLFVQPFQEYLAVADIRSFDQRTRRFTQTAASAFVRMVMTGLWRAAGIDWARWDLSMYEEEFGMEAASLMRALPQFQEILVGSASLPAMWTEDHINDLMAQLMPGESKKVSVTVPDPEGKHDWIEEVVVTKVSVDVHKLLARTVSATNGSGVSIAEFTWDNDIVKVPIPDEIRFGEGTVSGQADLIIKVHGGRRSGSGFTSMMNSWLNGIVTHGAFALLREPKRYKSFIGKRAKQFGQDPIIRTVVGNSAHSMRRGDDELFAIGDRYYDTSNSEMPLENVVAIAGGMIGRYGNAAKQRTGTWGEPDLEFASKYYSVSTPRGLTDPLRSIVRSLTTENRGLPQDEIRPWVDDESSIDLGIVSDTLTAKSRIMPQRGGPQGDPTPGNENIVQLLASMDKHGLTYGNISISDAQLQDLINAEARRYGAREAGKHNLHEVDVKTLEQEYLNSDIHWLLRGWFRSKPDRLGGREKGAAVKWYDDLVSSIIGGKQDV